MFYCVLCILNSTLTHSEETVSNMIYSQARLTCKHYHVGADSFLKQNFNFYLSVHFMRFLRIKFIQKSYEITHLIRYARHKNWNVSSRNIQPQCALAEFLLGFLFVSEIFFLLLRSFKMRSTWSYVNSCVFAKVKWISGKIDELKLRTENFYMTGWEWLRKQQFWPQHAKK